MSKETDLMKPRFMIEKSYPHLFKEISWWEFRNPDDMPEFVMRMEEEGPICVRKVTRHFYPTENSCLTIGGIITFYSLYEPATLQEYNDYINSLKQPS